MPMPGETETRLLALLREIPLSLTMIVKGKHAIKKDQ